jgi:hypothetical protein
VNPPGTQEDRRGVAPTFTLKAADNGGAEAQDPRLLGGGGGPANRNSNRCERKEAASPMMVYRPNETDKPPRRRRPLHDAVDELLPTRVTKAGRCCVRLGWPLGNGRCR